MFRGISILPVMLLSACSSISRTSISFVWGFSIANFASSQEISTGVVPHAVRDNTVSSATVEIVNFFILRWLNF